MSYYTAEKRTFALTEAEAAGARELLDSCAMQYRVDPLRNAQTLQIAKRYDEIAARLTWENGEVDKGDR